MLTMKSTQRFKNAWQTLPNSSILNEPYSQNWAKMWKRHLKLSSLQELTTQSLERSKSPRHAMETSSAISLLNMLRLALVMSPLTRWDQQCTTSTLKELPMKKIARRSTEPEPSSSSSTRKEQTMEPLMTRNDPNSLRLKLT